MLRKCTHPQSVTVYVKLISGYFLTYSLAKYVVTLFGLNQCKCSRYDWQILHDDIRASYIDDWWMHPFCIVLTCTLICLSKKYYFPREVQVYPNGLWQGVTICLPFLNIIDQTKEFIKPVCNDLSERKSDFWYEWELLCLILVDWYISDLEIENNDKVLFFDSITENHHEYFKIKPVNTCLMKLWMHELNHYSTICRFNSFWCIYIYIYI